MEATERNENDFERPQYLFRYIIAVHEALAEAFMMFPTELTNRIYDSLRDEFRRHEDMMSAFLELRENNTNLDLHLIEIIHQAISKLQRGIYRIYGYNGQSVIRFQQVFERGYCSNYEPNSWPAMPHLPTFPRVVPFAESSSNMTCYICLEDIEGGSNMPTLPYTHLFHA